MPVRAFETALLIALSLVAGGLALRFTRGGPRVLLLLLLTGALLNALTAELRFQQRQSAVLSLAPETARLLSPHFVVGYEHADALKPLIERGLVGGLFVTKRNVGTKTADQIRGEIAGFQALRQMQGLPPLLVSTDQEGGIVSRLSPPLEWLPPLASLVPDADSAEALAVAAEDYGRRQGQQLAALGITVNFSPVVDLVSGRPDNPLDFHSRIDQRAISADPLLTTAAARAYVRGLEASGVRATLKHFPGLGPVADDTHHFSATLNTSVDEMAERDWIPFREVARTSEALIMLGHVVVASLDPNHPASSSATVVKQVIRGRWNHDGVLITDDLTMAAAYDRGLCDVTVDALNASVDLLLIAYDYDKYFDAMACAADALAGGHLDLETLNASARRIERLLK